MDMFKKTFDRARQTVEEKFGDAHVTDYEPDVAEILARSEECKGYTEKILSAIEVMVQPDPAIRLLPEATKEGLNKPEVLAQEMGHMATKFNATKLGNILSAGEACYAKIGTSEREYISAVNQKVTIPIKRFLREEVHALDSERKILSTRRLDLDSLKGKAAKADAPPTLAAEVTKAETAFKEQQAKVKEVYKTKMEPAFAEVEKAVRALMETHAAHVDRQKALLGEMAKKV
jgi:hypothetical protein